ncbi:MAG: hypothetical protein OEV45_11435 [Desulfobacteraceae bacterium]|nr:hypothetical protein [Desulfobacteraceae bacterium]
MHPNRLLSDQKKFADGAESNSQHLKQKEACDFKMASQYFHHYVDALLLVE